MVFQSGHEQKDLSCLSLSESRFLLPANDHSPNKPPAHSDTLSTFCLFMGLNAEPQFQEYHRVGRTPSNVHHSHCYSPKAEDIDLKGNPAKEEYDLKSTDQDYTEISFDESQDFFYGITPYRPIGIAGNEGLKRGSIYQSSIEVRKMKTVGEFEGRRQIELLHSSDSSLSFQIVNSLSQPNDSISYAQLNRSLLMSSATAPDHGTMLDDRTDMELSSKGSLDLSFHSCSSPGNVARKDAPSDNFIEISLDKEDRDEDSAETIDIDVVEKLNLRCDQSIGPLNSGHCLLERDTVHALQKSSSAKVVKAHSRSWSKNDHLKASTKGRLYPIRRMLDPIMKSKSQRTPPVSVAKFGDVTTVGLTSIRRNKTVSNSLLNDYVDSVKKEEYSTYLAKKDQHSLDVALSPVHLQGLLKLEYKHGVPFLEFSQNNLEDTLVAKTWKGHNAFNWVYTFHSLNDRRKGSSGWGSKEKHKEAMVGQMQVSCYLCSEMRSSGGFDNSMVTEFVLYDIAHASKSFNTQDSPHCQPDPNKPPKVPATADAEKSSSMDLNGVLGAATPKKQARHACNDSDASTSYPWAPADLHSCLEVAAIVVQVPFQKRESLKDKEGVCGKTSSNLFDLSLSEQRSDDIPHNISPAKVKAVTSTGTHGLPSTKDGDGPSSLLDRWRSGGGCDCGGWDMACPLIVFGNANNQNAGYHHLRNRMPLELFVQGAKEKIPALTMTLVDEGQYLVDFHAQLSTLQAFSICVAILHSAADCTGAGQERTRQRLQCNSLKLLLEEEVRFLIEAVAEEEKRKAAKKLEEISPSFVVKPPFSPIARV